MIHFLLAAVGGAIGAGLRHLTGVVFLRWFGAGFPWGTLFVNVAGSLVMGLFIGWLVRKNAEGSAEALRVFFATGVLGGFTTFSAYSLDVATLWRRGAEGLALGYALGSVVLCVMAMFAGLWLVRQAA